MNIKINFSKYVLDLLKEKKIGSVSFYGSIGNKIDDKYSDIDIKIAPKTASNFYSNFKKYIGEIGPYYIIFPIVTDGNPQVFTIVWKDIILYKKMDLRVYSRANKKIIESSYDFNEKTRSFYDLFIGAIRFVKYRKRRNLVASMKFYRSAHESLLKICLKPKLLQKYFFLENDRQVDKYFIEILERYLKTSILIKIFNKNSNEDKFAKKVIEFVENELVRARN